MFLNKIFHRTPVNEETNMLMLDLNKNAAMVLDLTKVAPSLVNLKGRLHWDSHPLKNSQYGFDLDIFAFVLDTNGKLGAATDVAFFNNKKAHGVEIPKDVRDGGEDEEVFITLPNVPADKVQIDLYVFIHEYAKRGQNFSQIANAKFDLENVDTGDVLARYSVSQYGAETALHVGSLVRSGSNWSFEPAGVAAVADPNQVLQAYV
ncbi:hypothetical protein RsoM2USA_17 [Ralstonia phage RsoM2USA]|nr:hypothetical protein RsoM2USA_17 [Ralstonia phage RsoM2USA]